MVGDIPGSVSVGGLGSFVREGGGFCFSDTDGDLGGEEIGEIDGDFNGEGGMVGSSSSKIVELTLGESSMT